MHDRQLYSYPNLKEDKTQRKKLIKNNIIQGTKRVGMYKDRKLATKQAELLNFKKRKVIMAPLHARNYKGKS